MKIPVGGKYLVEITTPRGLGAGQIVRVYRKLLFLRRRISSDWFLDEQQAKRFARKTVTDLELRSSGATPQPVSHR